MVKALHAAGIEVILDVVYNHTAEGNHLGPTLSFKGIDNATYYRLVADQRRYYMDYTGTGNTLNLRHPQALRLIMDSLRYWVEEMHVDGFRFDLAVTLARGRGLVELTGHQLYAISDAELAAADAWLQRSGLAAGYDAAVAHYEKSGRTGADAALDTVFDKFVDVWQAEAHVTTYGEAVGEALRFRRERGREARDDRGRVVRSSRIAPRRSCRSRRR